MTVTQRSKSPGNTRKKEEEAPKTATCEKKDAPSSSFLSWKLLAIPVVFAVAYYGKQYASKEQLNAMLEKVESDNSWNAVFMCMAIIFIGTPLMVPVTPVELFCGYKYGMISGFAIVVIGKQLGGVVSYWLGRTLLYDFFRKTLVPKWDLLQALDGAFVEQPMKMAMVFRAGYIPVSVKNYGCAVLGCPFWQATAASMIFGPLYAATNIYLGATSREMRNAVGGSGEVDYVKTGIKVATGALCVGAALFALKTMKAELKKVREKVEKEKKEKEAKKD